ncbi:MAG: TolC family outer membrane protein [Sulfuricurvum sp.]|nr:TolC family outer membrane protein [Sulfuricurvum sp.]MDP3022531.1 TolC family outer membrane protein [Sulfuricurvum sp.]MDP3119664.1 TolC family outer membrane protein [Sulfuricurvum sp.]
MIHKWAIAATFSLCAISALNAFSLQDGTKEVITTHPVVLERLHNYRATLEDLRTTEAQFLPTLDYTGSLSREKTKAPVTNQVNRSFTAYDHSLQLTQNLFNGFGSLYEIDYNKARIVSASYHYVENVNDLAFSFVTAYVNAVKMRDILIIAEANVKYHEDITVKVQKLFDAGLTTRSEFEKADTLLSLAKSNLVVAQNNRDDALFNLERVYGKRVTMEDLQKINFAGELPDSLESMREYARLHNPSILVTHYNIKAASAQKKAAYKGYYPSIDAFARQSWASDTGGLAGNDDRTKLGLTLSYNLYRGGVDQALIQKSLSKINQESEIQRDTLRKLDEQGSLSWAARKNITNQIEHLKKYEASSKKTIELFQREYDLGRRTLLDLLVAQSDHIAAQTQIVRAENDLLMAHYRIQDAMGNMVSSILGTQKDEVFSTVGLNALDNRSDNDDRVNTMFFADRKSGKYQQDTEK